MSGAVTPTQLLPALQAYITGQFGAGARVQNLAVMEMGHAGLSFGFEVRGPNGALRTSLILKLAPPGVRRQGNTDVYRQAPLLRALHAAGLPVPDVPFASASEVELGTPFIIMERLAGKPFLVWGPDPAFDRHPTAIADVWYQAARSLAALHRFNWRRDLEDWETPRSLREEVERWDGILAKAQEPSWLAAGQRLRNRLLTRLPDGDPIGLVHGDYQPGNVLYDSGRLTGIIDWELASISSQLLDLGWLMMMADQSSWPRNWGPVSPPPPESLREVYEKALDCRFARVAWYRALAGYRFGAICCLNVRLHRTGRRPDPIWEKFALAILFLFGRAEELLLTEDI